MLFAMSIFGQIDVTGKVTSSEGEALPGVNIIIKGTSTGVITDLEGAFSITVPNQESVLIFKYIGFLSKEITVANQTSINVALTSDLTELDEVVVVGYGTQKKATLSGAVSNVKGKDVLKTTSYQCKPNYCGASSWSGCSIRERRTRI